MCGIIGYNGKNKPNLLWLKLISLYNDSRGGQGIGYSTNGTVYKSITPSTFSEYFQKENIKYLGKNNTIIMHTRKASVGNKSVANTHPFKVSERLIGVHNGTIRNVDEIVKSLTTSGFKIDKTALNKMDTDSEKIFYLLSLTLNKTTEVLETYDGGAALMFYNPKKVNELFIFKGGSNTGLEERPLYYMKDKKNTFVYLSSMEEPFKILQAEYPNLVIGEVPVNKLVTLQDGKFVSSIKITKEEKVQKVPANYNNYGWGGYSSYWQESYYDKYSKFFKKDKPISKSIEAGPEKKVKKTKQGLKYELQDCKNPGEHRLYIHNLFYHINGNKAHGVYFIDKDTLETIITDDLTSHNYRQWGEELHGEQMGYYAFYRGNLLSTNFTTFSQFVKLFNNHSFYNIADEDKAFYFENYFISPYGQKKVIYNEYANLAEGLITCKLVNLSFSCKEGYLESFTDLQSKTISELNKKQEEEEKEKIITQANDTQLEFELENTVSDYSEQLSSEFLNEVDQAFQILADMNTEYSNQQEFTEEAKLEYEKLNSCLAFYNNYEYIK
tara:strand:+ start:967 stop:2628 length:1662 start_codon:yes stop_codon:yes gene_type:complete